MATAFPILGQATTGWEEFILATSGDKDDAQPVYRMQLLAERRIGGLESVEGYTILRLSQEATPDILADTINPSKIGREEQMRVLFRKQVFVKAFSETSIRKALISSTVLMLVGGVNISWIILWSHAWIFGALIMCAGWTLLVFSVLRGLLNVINTISTSPWNDISTGECQ